MVNWICGWICAVIDFLCQPDDETIFRVLTNANFVKCYFICAHLIRMNAIRKFRSKHLELSSNWTHGRRQLHVKWTESVTNCELSIGRPFILCTSHVVQLFQTQHTHTHTPHTQYVGLTIKLHASNVTHMAFILFALHSTALRMLPSAKIETMNSKQMQFERNYSLGYAFGHKFAQLEANCDGTQWQNGRMHIGRLHDACLQEFRYTLHTVE